MDLPKWFKEVFPDCLRVDAKTGGEVARLLTNLKAREKENNIPEHKTLQRFPAKNNDSGDYEVSDFEQELLGIEHNKLHVLSEIIRPRPD